MIYVKKNITSCLDYSVCRKGPKRWSLMQFRVGPQLNFYMSLILAYIWFKLPMHVLGSTAASGWDLPSFLASWAFPGSALPGKSILPAVIQAAKSSWSTSAPEWIATNENVTPALSALPARSLYLWASPLPIPVPLFLWLFTIHSSKPKAQKCKLAE